jgi:hypothetical protein
VAAPAGRGCRVRWPLFGSGRRDRPDDEDRSAAQSFGRRSVAEDQLAHRPTATRVAILEDLSLADERPSLDRDLDRGVGQQVRGPGPIERAGCDEDRAVRLADEPDRDITDRAAAAAARAQPREPGIVGEARVEGRDALGAPSRAGDWRSRWTVRLGIRQRPRCQDLPSVATDGA